MRLTLIIATLALAQPAHAADQFDLICKGISQVGIGRRLPIEAHYRVDLATKQWCQGSCAAVIPIDEPGGTQIALVREDQKFERDKYHTLIVDRVSGKWAERYYSGPSLGVRTSTDGTCEPAEFSGFPSIRKF